jgi:hypothetical protein
LRADTHQDVARMNLIRRYFSGRRTTTRAKP